MLYLNKADEIQPGSLHKSIPLLQKPASVLAPFFSFLGGLFLCLST